MMSFLNHCYGEETKDEVQDNTVKHYEQERFDRRRYKAALYYTCH